MNILQIVSSSRISGAEKHVVVLSERLLKRGHSITALCPPGGWLPDQLRGVGVEVVESGMHGVHVGPATMRLSRLMRERKIDLIHSHLTCATYYGYLLSRLTQRPAVSSVHVRSRDLVYRRLFPQRNNHIITVSEWVREAFIERGVSADHVHTIYNGTDFLNEERENSEKPSSMEEELPIRAEFSLPPQAELIGIFARVDEFKGHPILMEAMGKIVAQRPNAFLICVGSVEPAVQKSLWELASQAGVADRIRFTGVRNDVKRIMAETDVVTLPSRYEACSMAIIEAMAMGKPVIATRAGGNPELIEDGKTGLLIERDPASLAHAVTSLLANRELKERIGNAARERAIEQFSARTMVDNIESLYGKILSSPSL
ncbi:MAG: glycosyltransferase family 4 protein [Chthonomonadaceae bacterium]|nr:glycosyltransferase family 4 protein [Chthonomonadaceae bacterium]